MVNQKSIADLIDYSVFPDIDNPENLETDADKADYVHRICAAWDFGILPTKETFELFQNWEYIFQHYPYHASPAYQTFQEYFGWELLDDPDVYRGWQDYWKVCDRIDGRELPDPCEGMV